MDTLTFVRVPSLRCTHAIFEYRHAAHVCPRVAYRALRPHIVYVRTLSLRCTHATGCIRPHETFGCTHAMLSARSLRTRANLARVSTLVPLTQPTYHACNYQKHARSFRMARIHLTYLPQRTDTREGARRRVRWLA